MTAPVRAPSPASAPSRRPHGAPSTAPAARRRAGAAASGRADADAVHRHAVADDTCGGVAAPQLDRPAFAPTRAPLQLVDDGRRRAAARRRRLRAAAFAGALLVIASLFGVVICHAMLVSGQGRLDRLQQEVVEEQVRYQALRRDVAELEAPGRIVAAAHALGMVSPEEITYLKPVEGAPAPPPPSSEHETGAPWNTMKPLLGDRG